MSFYSVNMQPATLGSRDSGAPPRIVTPRGLPAEEWRGVLARATGRTLAETLDVLGLAAGAALLVVGAHPDDEAIGCGRLIGEWTRTVGPAALVVATRGEAAVDHVSERPAGLAERRLEEWAAAAAELGVDDRWPLDLPDGQLADRRSDLEAGIVAVASRLATGADGLLIAATHQSDPHPDHEAVGVAAEAVAQRLGVPFVGYPVWLTYRRHPAPYAHLPLWRLLVSAEADEARARALACYVSQYEPLHPGVGPVVPDDVEHHHREQLLLPGLRGGR